MMHTHIFKARARYIPATVPMTAGPVPNVHEGPTGVNNVRKGRREPHLGRHTPTSDLRGLKQESGGMD